MSTAKKLAIPKALNKTEELFALHCKAKLHSTKQPMREYFFHPDRRWRADFSWPWLKLAVELDGGVHRIKRQFESDIAKHNALNLAGWTVLRYTPKMVTAGTAINEVMEFLARNANNNFNHNQGDENGKSGDV